MFASNLDEAIARKGMTNHDVGLAAGMSETAVSQYRRGRRQPKISAASALAVAVGATLDQLVQASPGEAAREWAEGSDPESG